MQTKYYLTFEQVGIIRRIPLKEQDPDMQGILEAFTQITNQGSLTNCLFLCVEPQLFKNNCMNKVIY